MMRRRSSRLGGAALALLLGLGAGQGLAEKLVLTAGQMKQTTFALIRQGEPEKALGFANALLQNHPNDTSVLVMKSRALRDLGRNADAVKTARLAWRHASDPQQRYSAAMVLAQGLASGGNKFAAQIWLRRAIALAPNPLARTVAETDFQYVRARSRLSLRFDASIQPSNNVNNGSSSAILHFLGLPFVLSGDAQALSGIEASFAATARYTVAESDTAKTNLRFGVTQKLVRLSQSARAQAPASRNGDYAFGGIEVGIEQHAKLQALRAEMTSSLSFGKNWYGGDPLSQYTRLDLGLSKALAPNWQGSIRLSGEHQARHDAATRSADILTLALGARHQLSNGDQVSFGLSQQSVQSQAPEIDHKTVGVTLDWARAKPVMGTKLSAGLSAERAHYGSSPYSLNGRSDVNLAANIAIAFEQIDYMGFIPVLSLQAQHVNSNIELYQSNTLGMGLSVQSRF